ITWVGHENTKTRKPNVLLRDFVLSWLHSKHPELRLRNRRVERGRQPQGQRLPRVRGIEDAVVPQARGRVVRRSLELVLVEDRLADRGFLFLRERLALPHQLLAFHGREDR